MNQPLVRILAAVVVLAGVGYFAIQAMLTTPEKPGPTIEDLTGAPNTNASQPPALPAPVVDGDTSVRPATTRSTVRATPTGDNVAADGQSSLAGRVINEAGEPVPEAEVHLYRGTTTLPGLNFPGSRQDTGHEVLSDNEGIFLFEEVPGDNNYVIVASHPEYSDAEYTQVALADGDSLFLPRELVLTEGARVFGVVQNESNAPIVGAVVSLWDTMASSFQAPGEKVPFAETMTDAEGNYAFRHVSFAGSKVTASAEGYATVSKGSTVLFAKVDDREINFVLPAALGLAGVVVDNRGLPIGGTVIQAYQVGQPQDNGASEGTAVSAPDGTFDVIGLSPGTYNLSARAKGFSDRQHGAAEAGSTGTRILMEPRGSVKGQASVLATGAPVTKFTVQVMQQRGEGEAYPTGRSQAFKSSDGSFELDDLDPGTYVLEVEAAGLAPTRSPSFVVDRAMVAGPVAIRLTTGATLAGTVADIAGNPLAGATVTIRTNGYVSNPIVDLFRHMPNTPQLRERATRTGQDGTFRMENLIPGTKQVEIKHSKYPNLALNDIELPEERTLDIGQVILSEGGTILGTALNEVGQPFSDCQITCTGGELSSAHTRPDANGHFQFNRLSTGEYSVSLQPERTADQKDVGLLIGVLYAQKTTQKVSVTTGQVTKVTLRMTPPSEIGGGR